MSDTNPLDDLKATLSRLQALNLPTDAQALAQQASKQAEHLAGQIQNLEQAVQEAQQARAKFVSVVTHELRLPLTSMKGYTDLLRQGIVGPVNDQQKNFLGVVRNNVDRMSALISDLADMAHAEAGRLSFSAKATSVQDVVELALQPHRSKFEEKNQTLEVTLAEGLPALTQDEKRLAQILGYLIGNAQRYTPTGGKVSLHAGLEGGLLRFEISDSGIGINAADQARIFTPFFRSEDEAVREHQGWGLALHVAKLLVELMGGQMGFESVYRQGSKFWFTVPTVLQ